MDKVGVFLCTGCGIGQSLAADKLEALARESGAVQAASTRPSTAPPSTAARTEATPSGPHRQGLLAT